MKKNIIIFSIFVASFFFQRYFQFLIEKEFISTLLTVFSIIFGFYTTSFAVFATSKYLYRLYQIENPSDNRKTLLDDLLEEFTFATYFLLASVVYLIIAYIFVNQNYNAPLVYFLYFLWGFLFLNMIYAFRTISTFIKVTRQSAKEKMN